MDKFEQKLANEMKSYTDKHVKLSDGEKIRLHQVALHASDRQKKPPITYWVVAAAAFSLFLLMSAGILYNSSKNSSLSLDEPLTATSISMEDLEKINVELLTQVPINTDETKFTIQVKNQSNLPILDMNLYLSYDIRLKNEARENPFQASVAQHVTIDANQTKTFDVVLPSYVFNADIASPDGVMIKMQAFLDEISNDHFFSMGKSNSVIEAE
ncbi:hypothetical protein [Sporosarcina sp. D27]|uniref:hypothetical protein n=1 Tax=Sporosarcina sp. D27 TaxID=1382305 RepID=UPI0004706730|nr:hypothetical protein [Sporosarcina sp. D27]